MRCCKAILRHDVSAPLPVPGAGIQRGPVLGRVMPGVVCDGLSTHAPRRCPPDAARLRIEAEDGGILAQYQLGVLFEQGLGRKPDPVLACHWYQQAAVVTRRDLQPALSAAQRERVMELARTLQQQSH